MANEHRNNPIGYKYTCGVPSAQCGGGKFGTSAGLSSTSQNHGHETPQEAFQCRRAYLIACGYTPVGSRAFQPPPDKGTEILILTKPSRFGGKMRGGKGKRYLPNANRTSGRRGGNVVSY
jgi:hypothetical protein